MQQVFRPFNFFAIDDFNSHFVFRIWNFMSSVDYGEGAVAKRLSGAELIFVNLVHIFYVLCMWFSQLYAFDDVFFCLNLIDSSEDYDMDLDLSFGLSYLEKYCA